MKNKWSRTGNFFKNSLSPIIKQEVTFNNEGISPILRTIRVACYSNDYMVIYLTPSPFFTEKLLFACLSSFKGKMDCLFNFDLMLALVKNEADGEKILNKHKFRRRFNEHEFMINTIVLFKFENQFFLCNITDNPGKLIKISDIDKFKKIKFDEKEQKILTSSQIPKEIYDEIIIKLGSSVLLQEDIKICIELKTANVLFSLFEMFNYFNREQESTPFPKELISELTNICLLNKISRFRKHIIPLKNITRPYVNSDKKDSLALSHELAKEPDKFSLQSCIEFLMEGHDPNGFWGDNFVLTRALSFPLIVLKWLIYYGGNPFESRVIKSQIDREAEYTGSPCCFIPSYIAFSPIEEALRLQRYEHLDYIVTTCSKPQKTLGESKSSLVKSIDFISTSTQVSTIFHINKDHAFISVLKLSENLSELEKKQLYELFSTYFKAESEEELKSIISEEIFKGKLIDLIFDPNQKMIGFISSEIEKNENHVTCEITYAVLLPKFHGIGFIPYLGLGKVFILGLLAPDFIVEGTYVALDHSSYRLTEDFLHFPKYTSAWNKYIEEELLIRMFGKELHYYKSGLKCYIEDNVSLKKNETPSTEKNLSDSKSKETNFKKEVFYHRQGADSDKDSKASSKCSKRVIPVVFMATLGNFNELCEKLLESGIDFIQYVYPMINAFQPLICKWLDITEKPLNSLGFFNDNLFFSKRKEFKIIQRMSVNSSHNTLNLKLAKL